MSGPSGGRRSLPGLATRAAMTLLLATLVSGATLGAVDLVTTPALNGRRTVPASGEEAVERRRAPEFGPGVGELALQLVLVAGVAFAGRRLLKIRL